jgi:hypothetical protein
MSDPDATQRSFAATMGRRYFDGTLTPEAIVGMFDENSDPLIQELLDLIVHEPHHTGLVKVSKKQYEDYRRAVERVLSELERGSAGVLPGSGRIKLRWLFFGWLLFLPFVGLTSADHAWKVIKHVRGAAVLPWWEVAGNAIGAAFMGICALAVGRALIYGTNRYREQRRRRAV